MRIRTIKPSFWTDEELADCSPWARLLFIGLWGISDRDGRLEYRPRWIKAQVFPHDNVEISCLIDELIKCRKVMTYTSNGRSLIHIPGFTRNQRISGKEADTASLFPSPPEGSDGEAVETQQGSDGEAPETTGREGKGREGKGIKPLPIRAEALRAWLTLFQAFWVIYPRKISKRRAQTAWKKLAPTTPDEVEPKAKIVATILKSRMRSEWAGRSTDTIPYPATFLNGESFEEEK